MAQQIPDVRVRLSPEGVDDVVRAFQQVSAAAKKSGKEASSGLKALQSAIEGIQELLPALSFGAAIVGITELVKHALESADAIGKLSQKTGLSTETLSALNVAAELADANFEQLSKGLIKFNKTMGELDQGSTNAGASVRRLFGSSQALNGLNTEQRLVKVVDALGKMEDGYKKTKAAQDFFGKSGADLIPLINDLANGGFEEARKKAVAFGLSIDKDTAQAAQRAADSVKLLKLEMQGAATQFVSGLAPAMADALESFSEGLSSDGVSGLKKFGEGVGTIVKLVVFLFETVGGFIGTYAAALVEAWDGAVDVIESKGADLKTWFSGLGQAAKAALQGDFVGAKAALETTSKALDASGQASEQRARERLARVGTMVRGFIDDTKQGYTKLFNSTEKREPDWKTTNNGGEQDAAAAKARLQLEQSRLDAELAMFKAKGELFDQQNKELYEQGLESLNDYFAKRRQIINAQIDKEIAVLERKKTTVVAQPTDTEAEAVNQQKELNQIQSQIDLKRQQRIKDNDALDFEQTQAQYELNQKRLQIEQQILTAQGNTYAAALAAIQNQADALRRQHIDPATINALTTVLKQQAGFHEIQRQAGLGEGALALSQNDLQNKVNAGQLFPFQAAAQYRQAVSDLLPKLQGYADTLKASAVSDEEIAAANQFQQRVDALGVSVDVAAQQMAFFKQNVESALESDLTNFFTSGIDQASGFGDAMRGLALSVVDSLRQIAAQMLATLITQKLLTAALKAGGALGFSDGGAVSTHASGGLISGPGTGTSDSIPARLSNGEFVVRAAAVRQPGVLPLLATINRGMHTPVLRGREIPRFANGGIVGATDAVRTDSGPAAKVHLGIEEGIFVKRVEGILRGKRGQAITIETLSRNAKRAARALGT